MSAGIDNLFFFYEYNTITLKSNITSKHYFFKTIKKKINTVILLFLNLLLNKDKIILFVLKK